MITINYYIVIGIVEEDEFGFVAPIFVDLEDLEDAYPGAEYIEVEVTQFNINNN